MAAMKTCASCGHSSEMHQKKDAQGYRHMDPNGECWDEAPAEYCQDPDDVPACACRRFFDGELFDKLVRVCRAAHHVVTSMRVCQCDGDANCRQCELEKAIRDIKHLPE